MKIRLLFLLSSALAMCVPLRAAPVDTVREVVMQFCQHYTNDDLPALLALWSEQETAPKKAFRVTVEDQFRVRCIELRGVVVDDATVNGDEAVAHVSLATVEWRQSNRMTEWAVTRNLVFRLANFGGWRITAVDRAEDLLAKQMMEAPSDQARASLFLQHGSLIDSDLATALRRFINPALLAFDRARAIRAIQLQTQVAAMTGDRAQIALAAIAESARTLAFGEGAGAARIDALNDALLAGEELHDDEVISHALYVLGTVYEHTPGGDEQAVGYFNRALELATKNTNLPLTSQTLNHLAAVKIFHGDYAGAIKDFQRQIVIETESHNLESLAWIEVGIGYIFQNENDHELARLHLIKALHDADTAKNEHYRAGALLLLADSEHHLGHESAATQARNEALELGRKLNDALTVGSCLQQLGELAMENGHFVEARHYLDESLATLRDGHRPRVAASVALDLAALDLRLRHYLAGVESAASAALEARRTEQDDLYAGAQTLLGEAHRALGHPEAALTAFGEAIDIVESNRLGIAGGESQQELAFERRVAPYAASADLLAELGKGEAGLIMAERAKGRVLLQALRGEGRGFTMTPAEQVRDAELSGRIARLNRILFDENAKSTPDHGTVSRTTRQLDDARSEWESFDALMNTIHPNLRDRRGDVPIATLQRLGEFLTPSSALLEYVVLDEQTRLFIVTKSGDKVLLRTLRIGVSRRELDSKASALADALAHGNLGFRVLSRRLYDLLVGPAAEQLRGVRTVVIVPDGKLWQIPFEALVAPDGRFMIESRACFYAPSASVFWEMTHRDVHEATTNTLFAVGNPTVMASTSQHIESIYRDVNLGPLPDAETEVRALGALYGAAHSRVLVGADARKDVIEATMTKYRILHFATHAIIDDRNPMYSCLILSQNGGVDDDGRLEAGEVMRSGLHADLAVLSACETARGRVAAGEGMIGLSWAFFVAGCPASVVSHWKVSSSSTAALMVDFHRALRTSTGQFRSAAALRQAKLKMLARPKWKHPFYWSAFVLVGSGG